MKKDKKALKPKLLLDRETLRHMRQILSARDLEQVAGASATSETDPSVCPFPH